MDESNKLSMNIILISLDHKNLGNRKSEIIMYIDDELYRNIPTVESDYPDETFPI